MIGLSSGATSLVNLIQTFLPWSWLTSDHSVSDCGTGPNFDSKFPSPHTLIQYQLGAGAFSVVKEGFDRRTKASYAIKIVTKSKLSAEDELALKDEISILKGLNHPNIIRLFNVFDEKLYYFLVTEKMAGGELFDRIVKKTFYNEKEARDTVLVLFQAIDYIHKHNIAHRDLKPENLLLQVSGCTHVMWFA